MLHCELFYELTLHFIKLQSQTEEYKEHLVISKIVKRNVNTFKKYNVDKYLSCNCLSVSSNYRGLNIGQRLLEAQYVNINFLG